MFGRRRWFRVEIWVGDRTRLVGWFKKPPTPEREAALVALARAALEHDAELERRRRGGAPRGSG